MRSTPAVSEGTSMLGPEEAFYPPEDTDDLADRDDAQTERQGAATGGE